MSEEFETPGILDAHGRPVTAKGIFEMQWKNDMVTRHYNARFYVFVEDVLMLHN
jgi:hypothetical protein